MVEAGCQIDCTSDTCKNHFFALRVTHDACPHDTLSRASEEGLHDMEESCAMHVCNLAGAEDSQLVCDDHHEDHDGKLYIYRHHVPFSYETVHSPPHIMICSYILYLFSHMIHPCIMKIMIMVSCTEIILFPSPTHPPPHMICPHLF